MTGWETREIEAMLAAGWTWREAAAVITEQLAPLYSIWWRFELRDMRLAS
jgi:hypothetical protein